MNFGSFDRRPIVVAIAGPNGAGKTTFYRAHVQSAGLRFVNADVLAGELHIEPSLASRLADALRRALLKRRESFVFETVFSDPVGDKLDFLIEARDAGYTVVMCFIGLDSPQRCLERVAMRVSQGGHDVPVDKLRTRFPRVLANLRNAIRDLPHVLVFDNSDLRSPFRQVAVFEGGRPVACIPNMPRWLSRAIRERR